MSMNVATQNHSVLKASTKVEEHCASGLRKDRMAITSWSQVDSVLREIAELQVAINQKINTFKKRIAKAEDDLHETLYAERSEQQLLGFKQQVAAAAEFLREGTKQLRVRQLYWETMLKDFMRLYYERFATTERHFRFGSLHCHGGKVDVLLNVDYAKAMLGKP